MTISTRTRVTALTAAGAALAGAAVLASGTAATGSPAGGSGQGSALAEVRAATARFHDVAVAQDAGYVPVSPCEELAGAGVMGIHYLNPALAGDGELDPKRPEVLLYLPTQEGLRLVGVEWFVAEAATGGEHPALLGRHLDGPMPGHSEGMPTHYDLHAWIWAHNPGGMFAAWNPSLTCDGEQ